MHYPAKIAAFAAVFALACLVARTGFAQPACSSCGSQLMDCLNAITPEINRTIKDHATLQRRQKACTSARDRCKSTCVDDSPAPPAPAAKTEPPPSKAPAPVKGASPKAATASKSGSCSDITGTGGPPSSASCRAARKTLQSARDVRKSNPKLAAKSYQAAIVQYRAAGDHGRAALVEMEANATDIAPFIEAETAAGEVQKNLAEAANNLSIAQRIEKGAYESGSCADLQVAANYYLEAARYFLRADRFSTVNAVLLHKDHVERIVDEARQKGRCSRPLTARRPAPSAEPVPAVKQLPPDQCKALFDTMRRIHEGIKKAGRGGSNEQSAHTVELAATVCHGQNASRPTSYECNGAKIHWHYVAHVPLDEIERRLKAAGCGGPSPRRSSAPSVTPPTGEQAAQPTIPTTHDGIPVPPGGDGIWPPKPTNDDRDWRSWLWQSK